MGTLFGTLDMEAVAMASFLPIFYLNTAGPWAFPGEKEESAVLLLPILGVLNPRPGPRQAQRTAGSFSAEPLPVMLVLVGRCGCFVVESVIT